MRWPARPFHSSRKAPWFLQPANGLSVLHQREVAAGRQTVLSVEGRRH